MARPFSRCVVKISTPSSIASRRGGLEPLDAETMPQCFTNICKTESSLAAGFTPYTRLADALPLATPIAMATVACGEGQRGTVEHAATKPDVWTPVPRSMEIATACKEGTILLDKILRLPVRVLGKSNSPTQHRRPDAIAMFIGKQFSFNPSEIRR